MTDSARAGRSLASVPDDELDAYIADLILQKSKAKEARSQHEGMAASLEDDDSAAKVPNTNKRFLASVIRNVEGHNQALLRQQAMEERSQSAGHRRTRTDADADSGPSRLRGWSDAEEEEKVGHDGRRSIRPACSRNAEGEDESHGLSSKMDKYFEDASDAEGSRSPSASHSRSDRARGTERHDSHHRSSRHARDTDRHASSKSRSSRHRHGSPHESRRDSSKRSREDRHGRGDEEQRRHRASERHRPHRSSRRERDEECDDDDRRRRRRQDSSKHRDRDRDRARSHRGRRDKDRKRSASPPTEPPKKVREWDLGKDSLAF